MKISVFFKSAFLGSLMAGVLMVSAPSKASSFGPLSAAELYSMSSVDALDLINWKVGDTMTYQVSMGFFGKIGSMVKSVTKDEGTSIWLTQNIALQSQKELVEVLFNKADGKILKMIRNGSEMQIPDDKIEVISQDYAEVTVPAGTFQSIHIVAKSKQVSKIEMWANPTQTAIDGAVKQIMATQFGDMVLELASFKRN